MYVRACERWYVVESDDRLSVNWIESGNNERNEMKKKKKIVNMYFGEALTANHLSISTLKCDT